MAAHPAYPNLQVLDHPLIQDKLARVRDETTPPEVFRSLVSAIAQLMVFQVSRHLPVHRVMVSTPMERAEAWRVAAPITVVPILRAGIGMSDGIVSLLPEARTGHIGLYRDEETLEPVTYYCKLPEDIADGPVILVDPMLATGGSAVAAARLLGERRCSDIRMICLVAAPAGVRAMHEAAPAIPVYAAALDRELNERGYILPGLGDAGDRIFGTR